MVTRQILADRGGPRLIVFALRRHLVRPVAMGRDTSVVLAERVGWVLQSFRRYSGAGRAVSMQEMTAQLSAGDKVHRSHISRWESGSIRPSWAAVLRYEQILSLPARQLVAAIDATARAARPQTATP